MPELAVTDNPAVGRFEAAVDGHVAELVYRRNGNRLVLVHTGVPDELGGHGIGGRLVAKAVEVARDEGMVIVPLCPFASAWLREHPDDVEGVTIDWPR